MARWICPVCQTLVKYRDGDNPICPNCRDRIKREKEQAIQDKIAESLKEADQYFEENKTALEDLQDSFTEPTTTELPDNIEKQAKKKKRKPRVKITEESELPIVEQ